MNTVIKQLRNILYYIIKRIDDGDCDLSEEEATDLICTVKRLTEKDRRMSKYAACEYLHVSRATFDNYVADGKIPQGVHEQGFKELSWYKKDLDAYKEKYGKVKK